MIYIDTSAAMKLVRPEEFSHELVRWLGGSSRPVVLSSALLEVELMRATQRSAPEQLERAAAVLRGISVVALSPAVIKRAAGYVDDQLRSLEALHIATAEHVLTLTNERLDAFIAYDHRLLAAARGLGLSAVAPGVD